MASLEKKTLTKPQILAELHESQSRKSTGKLKEIFLKAQTLSQFHFLGPYYVKAIIRSPEKVNCFIAMCTFVLRAFGPTP